MCLKLICFSMLEGTDFHWIFAESHHGKGEHDGHGATSKIAIKLHVLGGMYGDKLSFFQLLLC